MTTKYILSGRVNVYRLTKSCSIPGWTIALLIFYDFLMYFIELLK